jgi:bile acid:Na+ symporter, BASS family
MQSRQGPRLVRERLDGFERVEGRRRRRHGTVACTEPGVMPALRAVTTALSALYLVSMMFALGLELGGSPKESKEKKRAKRRMLVRGLVVNLVVFPAVAFGITRVLHASNDVTIALMLLASVPGGRFAPHLVKLGNGDVPLAIELTLFLAKLTAFTAAPTARWLLGIDAINVHELPLIAQLILLQIVPLYAGKWLRRKHRPVAERLLRPSHRVAIAAMLAVFLAVLLREDRGLLEVLSDRAWLAVAATGLAWPLLGWLLGSPAEPHRRTFAITADAREIALALVLASLAFPPRHGVHTAIFGIWSIFTLVSVLLAAGMRSLPGVRAIDRAREAPAGVRSAPAR